MTDISPRNVDPAVVRGFGEEWQHFDQIEMSDQERQALFNSYFAIFPWEALPPDAVGFDAGCGSGRWAVLVAPRVGHLHCVDPSAALDVAARALKGQNNCSFHRAIVDEMPFDDGSMDFGYSLGVLHHVPDTAQALGACVRKLKPGAPFLVYLYYAFDNQPRWFRLIWKTSEVGRYLISRLPKFPRLMCSQLLATFLYWPLARFALILERLGAPTKSLPLSAYRHRSFYAMRTDALDRFGTVLERRFSRAEIHKMMTAAGLEDVKFSPDVPYWCAVGRRKREAES
jgi:ubiquinone/menaquinone biosynthesis C-methylase UbiE